ncbi:MAG: DUF1203 domain-containing protein [Alphaproteobacteria bacterium]|jgi:hypothetical protein|nr:DUF1203 domain-containing protein [Alphaproteobacteria bacterium]
MPIHFTALPTDAVRHVQAGGADAYGLPAERQVSDGVGVPCRHCLAPVAAGHAFLVLAWRPFGALQPYAETGPIFLHADACARAEEGPDLPAMLQSPEYLIKGYDADEWIVYGTGAIVPTAEIPPRAETLLADPAVAFVDVRSARNNCFQCRIVRA